MNRVFFKTFGCRTNIYDTQVMISSLDEFVSVESEAEADIIVVNSCTVTNGADSGARGYINQQKRAGKKVILAGCGAFSKGEELFKSGAVFGVLGHSQKQNISKLLANEKPFFEQGDLNSLDTRIVSEYEGKTKAFVKIQEGCNFRCSYCIIPHVRGDSRSQDEGLILSQIETLAKNGYGEIVLTGTNIGSYGRDKKSSLGELLQKIGVINGVRRVRLGSIEPIQIDESFREILKENWLEKHLHVAIQHSHPTMLKIMQRRNTLQRDLELFCELNSLGFALGTDFILGHPGESEEIWSEAYENLKKFPLTHVHAFTYSKRDGTPSALMKPQIDGNIAKVRLKTVEELVGAKNLNFRLSHVNTPLDILVEERDGEFLVGYDQFYNKCKIKTDLDLTKEWIRVEKYTPRSEFNEATI